MKRNLDNITSQKWGARHIGELQDHRSGGGLEPLDPIGVYAYVCVQRCGAKLTTRCDDRLTVVKFSQSRVWDKVPLRLQVFELSCTTQCRIGRRMRPCQKPSTHFEESTGV